MRLTAKKDVEHSTSLKRGQEALPQMTAGIRTARVTKPALQRRLRDTTLIPLP